MAAKKSRSAGPASRGKKLEVGFVGLGNMGCPMALNLLKRDRSIRLHVPTGCDPKVNLARLKPATRVVFHKTIAEIGAAADVCFTMLPMPKDVESVVLGETGLIGSLKRGAMVIDCSTSSAELAREIDVALKAVGCAGIDSPVSGSPVRAEEGTLSLMVGARKPVYKKAEAILSLLGKPTHMGMPGCGQITKSINQIIVGLVMAAIGEGIILGRAAGIDLQAMLEAVGEGLAGTEVMRIKGPDMIRERFEPGAFLKYHLKDLDLAVRTAEQYGLTLPFTNQARGIMQMAVAMGRDEIDHSGLMTVIESMNGIAVPKRYAGK